MKCTVNIFSCIVLFLLLLNYGDCSVKKWLRNTNYNNTKNWDKARIPCLTDTVIFPKDLKMPVELPENKMEVYKVILPAEGGLVFPHKGEIILSNIQLHGKCEGGDIVFKRKGIAKWLDYENWSSDSNEATPHTERIPCDFDQVVFPTNSTFFIELPPYTTRVSTVTIQGKNLTGKSWEDVLESDVGSKGFPSGEHVIATGEQCETQDRCDECAGFPRFCRPCPQLVCEDPVKPLGFCCPICGGYLLFLENNTIVANVRKAVEKFPKEDIIWHVSFIRGYIQVVLVQKSNYFTIDNVVNDLKDYLLAKNLGLKSFNYLVSGSMIRRRSASTTFGLFFAYMIVIFLISFGVVYYYHNSENLSWRDFIPFRGRFDGRFMFARFENVSGVVELGNEQLIEEETNQVEDITRAFDNPMYSDTLERPLMDGAEFCEVPIEENVEKMSLETFIQSSENIESTSD